MDGAGQPDRRDRASEIQYITSPSRAPRQPCPAVHTRDRQTFIRHCCFRFRLLTRVRLVPSRIRGLAVVLPPSFRTFLENERGSQRVGHEMHWHTKEREDRYGEVCRTLHGR